MNWYTVVIFSIGFICGWFAYMGKITWGFWKATKTSPVCPACRGKWEELRKELTP